jgi:hypothetical protein
LEEAVLLKLLVTPSAGVLNNYNVGGIILHLLAQPHTPSHMYISWLFGVLAHILISGD